MPYNQYIIISNFMLKYKVIYRCICDLAGLVWARTWSGSVDFAYAFHLVFEGVAVEGTGFDFIAVGIDCVQRQTEEF